ncbi:hypothetical protein S7711_11079 [Stachybotrys chartarum IBT 7711]|uniref:Uncharacterized protein n=1 Tax=Stachybotrys chartarum (strain CBS 109288 / IBT 7711) TaxID=1280523 RepID=A0A084AN46_STACB|nr:hypothetical protein S7711_11079 [Stachybotrys chartarum IBT 7711]KFA74496.1 hypothetical protein S40288_11395 [Stachybotrys chartarum IBT 40288]
MARSISPHQNNGAPSSSTAAPAYRTDDEGLRRILDELRSMGERLSVATKQQITLAQLLSPSNSPGDATTDNGSAVPADAQLSASSSRPQDSKEEAQKAIEPLASTARRDRRAKASAMPEAPRILPQDMDLRSTDFLSAHIHPLGNGWSMAVCQIFGHSGERNASN